MKQRKYLPTLAELLDRMTICQLKSVFISENKKEYDKEIEDIMHDVDICLEGKKVTGKMLRALSVIMLTNRFIWENESRARAGEGSQDKLLKLTHSINGVRAKAKNVISQELGERVDLKVDCLASELLSEFGAWNIWTKKN